MVPFQLLWDYLINVFDPTFVAAGVVATETNEFDVALLRICGKLCSHSEFSGANGGVVVWVGKQNVPTRTRQGGGHKNENAKSKRI